MIGALFNLLLNSTLSFWGGVVFSLLAIKMLGIQSARWRSYFLTLPFGKILFDIYFYGLPESSVILQWANPLELPPRHQLLTIGAGVKFHAFPFLHIITRALNLDGQLLSTSLPDYLFFYLAPRVGMPMMALLVLFLIGVSLFKVSQRLINYVYFQYQLKADFSAMKLLAKIEQGQRHIRVYQSPLHHGPPFTTRLISPIIIFPAQTYEHLNEMQIQAVLAHELSHIRHWDLLVTLLIQLLGDFFWFIPGQWAIHRQLEHHRELIADEQAQKAGASGPALASALLKVKECTTNQQQVLKMNQAQFISSFLSTMKKYRPTLKQRILVLTQGSQKTGRWERIPAAARWALAFWASAAILLSILLGTMVG